MKTIYLRKGELVPEKFTGIVLLPNGDKQWYLNGKHHREDGPAIEYANGSMSWWINGHRHREDGPAGIYTDSIKGLMVWLIHGEDVFNNRDLLKLEGNYIVVERGIPTDKMFGSLKLTHTKLLTAEGTMFVPDNLPGMENFIKND
jgi:hypothetical protein